MQREQEKYTKDNQEHKEHYAKALILVNEL